MSSISTKLNDKTEYDEIITNETQDPIIFARTETNHIPKTLQYGLHIRDVSNTIYNANRDGTLKLTPITSTIEEENIPQETNEKPSFLRRLLSYFCCCKTKEVTEMVTSVTSPILQYPNSVLLGEQRPCDTGKKTLVLDLDETLVHSSFQPSHNCQYIIPVEIEGNTYNVYVFRRPGTIEFIKKMSEIYEIVVYTASLKKYADPLLDQMDPDKLIAYRLFREHCVYSDGLFVKDLGLLGRDLESVIMIDNASVSYKFQPNNGIECTPFIDDFNDKELSNLTPFLEYVSKKPDVRKYLSLWEDTKHSRF